MQPDGPKLVVITGVGRGLGRVMAEQFIRAGHTVVGCTLNPLAVTQLREHAGAPHSFATVDITKPAQVQTWGQTILTEQRAPDLLLNNAGVAHALAPLWQVPAEVFDRVIDVNIKGTANIIRTFVPAMIARGRGVIVNFSAGWGRFTVPNASPYCASKWAIEGLTKALAQELPRGMAAVSLWPGSIHTDSLETVHGADKARHYISPEDWIERALPFLLHIGASDNGKALSIPTG